MIPHLIEEITDFQDGARFDWLHPQHGPFPDLCVVLGDHDGEYLTAVWDVRPGDEWICAVEGPPIYHCGLLMSYRFWRRRDSWVINCAPTKNSLYEFPVNGGTTDDKMLRLVADRSVYLYANVPS